MKYKAVSRITGEEFPFYFLSRKDLEELMLDAFDMYLHEADEDYLIYYSTASDSFHYEKNHAIYELNF